MRCQLKMGNDALRLFIGESSATRNCTIPFRGDFNFFQDFICEILYSKPTVIASARIRN